MIEHRPHTTALECGNRLFARRPAPEPTSGHNCMREGGGLSSLVQELWAWSATTAPARMYEHTEVYTSVTIVLQIRNTYPQPTYGKPVGDLAAEVWVSVLEADLPQLLHVVEVQVLPRENRVRINVVPECLCVYVCRFIFSSPLIPASTSERSQPSD